MRQWARTFAAGLRGRQVNRVLVPLGKRRADRGGRRTRFAVGGVLLGLLLGCGSPPTLTPLPPDGIVLAFGNSLTIGTGAKPDESYPSEFSRLIGREVINAGVPGEVTAGGLRRLPGLLDSMAPDLVILCHGGNDILKKLDLAVAEANIREMVALIRASGAQVVMLGVPRPGIFLSAAEYYSRIADDLGIPFDGDVVADLLGDNQYKSDAIHPNAAGYARLAKAVEALLVGAGAI